MCPHVDRAEIAADRENLKDSVYRIKHAAEWLYDAGDSVISLEHVRAVIDRPPSMMIHETALPSVWFTSSFRCLRASSFY